MASKGRRLLLANAILASLIGYGRMARRFIRGTGISSREEPTPRNGAIMCAGIDASTPLKACRPIKGRPTFSACQAGFSYGFLKTHCEAANGGSRRRVIARKGEKRSRRRITALPSRGVANVKLKKRRFRSASSTESAIRQANVPKGYGIRGGFRLLRRRGHVKEHVTAGVASRPIRHKATFLTPAIGRHLTATFPPVRN